ncbi:hypothetical protein [Bacillus cereus]|uniref:hypothetical protein n=1 Tax=Bacillus cereus TaxID=1396 RepID=UPI0015CF5E54|nr:hypothetical protein [Bacillus cereus]
MNLKSKFTKEVQFKIHENVLKELGTTDEHIKAVATEKGIYASIVIDYLRNVKN